MLLLYKDTFTYEPTRRLGFTSKHIWVDTNTEMPREEAHEDTAEY
jgi:hypothetical protein